MLLRNIKTHPSLEVLDLQHKGLTGSCFMELKSVCEGVPTLHSLRLGRNTLQPACMPLLLRALQAAPGLKRLALQDCKLTAEDLLPLARAIQGGSLPIQELDITYNMLGSGEAAQAVMQALGAASSLRVLRASSTGIGSPEVQAFADARVALQGSQLNTLWLNRNSLCLAGLGHAVRAIAQPIPHGTDTQSMNHTELQVQWCIPSGAALGDVQDLLSAATAGRSPCPPLHLGMLDLKGCALGEHGVRAVVHALRQGGQDTPHGISAQHMSLFGVAAGNDAVQHLVQHLLAHAPQHADLGVLDVGGNDLTDAVADSLQTLFGAGGDSPLPLSALRVLDISANDLSEAAVAALLASAGAAPVGDAGAVQLLHAGQGDKRRETEEGDDSVAAAAAAGTAVATQ